jgi:hypothetical protein
MKKIIGRISKLEGQLSYINSDKLTKNANRDCTMLSTYATDDKLNSLDASDKPERTMESGELNINREKHKISNQKDSRQSANVFLIENYAELLIQKLIPLSSNGTRLDYYSPNDL